MLWIPRCQALRWSTRPLAQRIRPLSQTFALRASLRPTPCLRQETPAPPFRDKVGPLEYSDSFYEKVGKPRIRNQVLVSRVITLSLLFSLLLISEQFLNKFVVVGSFVALTVASAKTTIETEYWAQRMVALSSVWNLKTITNTDLKRAQNVQLIQVSTGARKTIL